MVHMETYTVGRMQDADIFAGNVLDMGSRRNCDLRCKLPNNCARNTEAFHSDGLHAS